MSTKKIKEAWMVAEVAHQGQMYDIFPYKKHLNDGVEVLKKYGYTEDYIIAMILHDVAEDSGVSYNDIKNNFGKHVAEMVYAVTDGKGRNRTERKKQSYEDIKAYPDSSIIKTADRIVNLEHSIFQGNKKIIKIYKKEHKEFKENTHTPGYAEPLWEKLEKILEKQNEKITKRKMD